VRIAFSGSHRTGKSTLLTAVAERLPGYTTVDEPYHLLEDDGYECGEEPSVEDFEAQLVRSIEALREGQRDVLFDRCPADVVAYLMTHEEAAALDGDAWMDRARDAMETLDLIVFVPIEARDRIAVGAHEDGRWRAAVDAALEELLIDNALELAVEVMQVEGDVAARVAQVMARIAG
jgi:predicted ATPase